MDIAYVCLFAFLAGFVDAIAGGGGLIQLPAILVFMPQLSLAQSLATVRTASLAGTSMAAFQFGRRMDIAWKSLIPALIAAPIASVAGSMLVSRWDKDKAMPVILVALTIVLVFMLLKSKLGLEKHEAASDKPVPVWGMAMTGLVLGFYDGAFGPGTGSFLIFSFVIFFQYNFLQASAASKMVNLATNVASVSFFLFKGYIVFPVAIPMALCNIAGAFLGSRLAMKGGSQLVRWFFLAVVLTLIIKLGISVFS